MDAANVDVDLGRLVERVDPESRDVFLSVYVDATDQGHEKALSLRSQEIEASLETAEEVEEFRASWELVESQLRRIGARREVKGMAIFASSVHGFQEGHALAAPVPTRMVLDSSPYVRPLARFQDAYEAFLLILLDGQRGTIYLVDQARAEKVGGKKTKLIGRHRNGGMSQMRYQRHRQGVVNRFYDDLVEQADRVVRDEGVDRLVVAGPGEAKRQLVGRLTPQLKEALVAVEDTDFGDEGDDELIRRFVALGRALEANDSAETARQLRRALRRGELALMGAFPVARAAFDGRVDVLVVRKDSVAGGRKCEAHNAFFESAATCHCGSQGTEVDLINEAIEYTARADGTVEFVPRDNEVMQRLGDVGALVRW